MKATRTRTVGARFAVIALLTLVAGSFLFWGEAGRAQEFETKESPPPAEPPPDDVSEPDQETEEEPPTDDTGGGDTGGDDVTVGSAILIADPLTGTAPLTVTFDPSGSTGVSSYQLDFGDGETTSGKGTPVLVAHTYPNVGDYTATLTVLSLREQTLSDSVTIAVTEATPTPTDTATNDNNNDNDDNNAAPGAGPGNNRERRNRDEPSVQELLDAETLSAEEESELTGRSLFVSSVHDPTELSFDPRLIAEALLLTAVFVLLIGFPAEMFNATLLENYEEISGWFDWSWLNRLREWIAGLHGAVVAVAFAAIGAIIHANLEPHFGFDKGSLALILGIFITFLIISLLYDVLRGTHLRRRHDLSSRLRAQALGMVVAAIMVLFSRIGHFHPGYMYGLFTALAYAAALHDRHHGRALAFATIRIGIVGVVAWFAWIPIKHMAEEPDAGFVVLTLEASLVVLWVASVAIFVFGLAPLRFFYGEQVKKWSFWGWLAIWVPGVFMFVYTLVHPERGLYGASEEASLFSVMLLFICFGTFSLAFWSYFKIRNSRRESAAGATEQLPTS